MSSSYSPDLRLELIGTGDQAGVWGSTTNTNLGTLIENAVAGYTSVSIVASPQALTANDGAEDQARYAIVALTTTTGANFTVCIPPNSKQYTLYNASSYVATITNATAKNGITPTGGTTVAIPSGKTMTLWSDGTNVTQQNDHFIGTPTAPTAAFGTSTVQLATTAFVQAALQALHPIGSIYTSTDSTNPGTSFGFGTWVAYGAGRVLLGNGGGYTAGATGGSADAIVVSHNHTATSSSSFSGSAGTTGTESAGHTHGFSFTTGGMNSNAFHNHSATSTDSGHGHSYKTYGLGNNGLLGNAYTNYDWGYATSGTGYANITTSIGNTNIDHTHSYSGTSAGNNTGHTHSFTPAGSVSTSTTVASSGSSGTGANLQPYVVVYMWNRTA